MNVSQLYAYFEEKLPRSLSCSWDNDGLMCCPDREAEITRVLIALDITAAVVDRAIAEGYDLILSHHPLIFSPIKALDPCDHVAKKLIALLRAGVTAMSFHTRLDAVEGGVNDLLAADLGLFDVVSFGEDGEGIGRIGVLSEPTSLDAFASLVKRATNAKQVRFVSADRPVYRVAVLGGSGSSEVRAAEKAGADTYVSGELKHNYMTDAPECNVNLIEAGHFHTENAVCQRLAEMVREAIPHAEVTVVSSDPVQYI